MAADGPWPHPGGARDRVADHGKEATMAYVVKWVAAGQRKIHESPTPYTTPSNAIDFACTVLKQRPERIWIEGPTGIRIEQDAIKLNCGARGMR
jgi:hypothetical protein